MKGGRETFAQQRQGVPSGGVNAKTRGSFEPYLPRLVLDWAARTPGERWRELDGSLVSVDLTGFTALAERLQAKGRAGAE